MSPRDAAALTAALVVALLAAAWWYGRPSAEGLCGRPAGPDNLQTYDSPYVYPRLFAERAAAGDVNNRCTLFCGQLPCARWCRADEPPHAPTFG